MISFLEVYEDTREKLGRELSEIEIIFLQRMHECYETEQKEYPTMSEKSI